MMSHADHETHPRRQWFKDEPSVDVFDGPRPVDRILRRHVPARDEPGVLIGIQADVDEILSSGRERAATDAVRGWRRIELRAGAREQVLHDLARQSMALRRIHET